MSIIKNVTSTDGFTFSQKASLLSGRRWCFFGATAVRCVPFSKYITHYNTLALPKVSGRSRRDLPATDTKSTDTMRCIGQANLGGNNHEVQLPCF